MATKKASSPRRKTTSAPKVSKAEREAQKTALEQLKNSREYPELTGMLGVSPYKTLASVEWLNERLPVGESKLEKSTKKEKERFVLAVIRKGNVRKVIDDLKDAPAQKCKEFMVGLTKLSLPKAEESLKALKPKDLTTLLVVYQIEPVRSGAKQAINKAKTILRILTKLTEIREYLKL